MTDSREIFSGKEQQYDKNRPHYPARLIDFLYDEIGFCVGSVIADIGSGTGIFSKQLAERGSTVICVEPNAAMRSVAQAKLAQYPHVRFTSGDCENTELAERSVDFITAAQAFHWFDAVKFRAESRRILKPNGKSVLVWNRRDEASAVNQRTAEALKRYCPDFHGYGGGMKDEENIERYFGGRFDRFECENDLVYDREGFIGRNLSGSYAPRKEDESYEPLVRTLGEIFDEFASDGRLTVPHKTAAYWEVL